MASLYLDDTPPTVEKLASKVQLSDTADTWPREVLRELLKQHPFLGNYEVTPVMKRVDGEQGYGFGHFQVHSGSAQKERGEGTRSQMKDRGVKYIKIPIVVKNSKLQPIDVFMKADGDPSPLTEERIRAALFRPQVFDTAKKTPGDVSMSDQLLPPTTRQHAMSGGQVVDVSQTKLSSAKPRLLIEAIAPTISQSDLTAVGSELRKDASLARALGRNEATRSFMKFLGGLEPTTAADVEKVASASVQPNVLQVERDGERYFLKMANSDMFEPEVTEADRASLVEIAGKDLVTQADQYGAATLSTNPVVHDALEDEEIKPISSFGEYRVKTKDGTELFGWVFPTVLDYDGTALPFSIFTNGAASMIQETIVGSFVGKSPNIIRSKPKGYGFFYRVTSTGGVIAFQPTDLEGAESGEKGSAFRGSTMMGDPVTIRFNSDVRAPTQVGETEFVLPSDVRWAPLSKRASPLMDNPAQFVKASMAKKASSAVRIVSDKETWSFSGAPVEKVAHRWREQLHGGDAAFTACALGMEPAFALTSMIKAAREGSTLVYGCRPITPYKEKLAEARDEAKKMWAELPPRFLLLKEAAALEDITTVDKVLSLGFLNPENLNTFVSWLPDLEDSLSKMAGLLMAVRLGMEDVEENAVKSAMERTDQVVSGLKKLVYRKAEGSA